MLLWLTRAFTLVLAARVILLSARYLLGVADVRRYQVESAAVALVVVGALLLIASSRGTVETSLSHARVPGEWIGWCLASLILYWPSLYIGLLSDDFVLVDHVRHFAFGLVQADLFRPAPLFAWGGLLAVTGGPVALHVLNIIAHGLAAFLTSRLAAPLVTSRFLSVGAGLLVLTFPANVEAVAWAAGVFDVTATVLMLTTILVSRRYGAHSAPSVRIALFACAIAALLCKETAVVIPALIALDAWATGRRPHALLIDTVTLAVLFAGVAVGRLVFASAMVRQPLTRYMVQRWLFGTVAGLAVPWHQDIASMRPWIVLAGALLVLGLATAFLVVGSSRQRGRIAAACAASVFAGTLPTVTFFFVGTDLQGARYLYLSAVGYALLLVTMAGAWRHVAARAMAGAAIIVLVLDGAAGVRWHQAYWQQAAHTRDMVLTSAGADERVRACGTISVGALPDSDGGAYVFRNGAELAFASAGLTLSSQAVVPCAFTWDTARTGFRLQP